MLAADLAAVGVPYVVPGPDGPLYADFHALRHTYVSMLTRSGLSVKQAQKLARHSTPELTIGRYTHAELVELGEAVGKLPAITARAESSGLRVHCSQADLDTMVALAGAGLVVLAVLTGQPLVAPRVAPTCGRNGDSGGRSETDAARVRKTA
jgi:hypothetical protein